VVLTIVVVVVAVVEAPLSTTVVTTATEMPSLCDAAECNGAATDTDDHVVGTIPRLVGVD
jgi:hypothetical protein